MLNLNNAYTNTDGYEALGSSWVAF